VSTSTFPSERPQTLELLDFLRVVRKGWLFVVAFVVLGAALGVGLTLATETVYQANVQVFVATATTASAADLVAGNSFSQDRVQSYTSIATSPAVTAAVIQQLHLALSQEQLSAKITADAPPSTVLINIHVTDHNPQQAATLANLVALKFDDVVQKTEQNGADRRPVVTLTVIHPAVAPLTPIKPNKVTDIGLGVILGLLLGVGFVVARNLLDNTMKTAADFEPLGIPVLAQVPFDKRSVVSPNAFGDDSHNARCEAYRQLRTNLQFVEVDQTRRVIAVTSPISGEGKSTTALNLAAVLAESGFRVCLVEADLRRPTLAQSLGLVADVGFTTALIGRAPLQEILQPVGANLTVLVAGPIPPNPSELLLSEHARTIIADLAKQADYTIIDTAPLLPVADGAQVAALADATLIVQRAGKSTRDDAKHALQTLNQVGVSPVGVVLNMISRGGDRYDRYGSAYGAEVNRRSAHVPVPERNQPSHRRAVADERAPDPSTANTSVVASDRP